MSGEKKRRSVSDRARRRAIRAHAAALGVPYSVAARLLRTQAPVSRDEHRQWLFAVREQRPFSLRRNDTRLAADLPAGRAAHLTERFPPLRGLEIGALYDGEFRQSALTMLYTVLMHETPQRLPPMHELEWVADLGEETAVDFVCAAFDRAARLLLDEDPWRLFTRIEAALEAAPDPAPGAGSDAVERRNRLRVEFRTMFPHRSLGGARHILDALLAEAHDGHAPGAQVLLLTRPWRGRFATVVGAHWSEQGPPTHYDVRIDSVASTVTFASGEVAPPGADLAHTG